MKLALRLLGSWRVEGQGWVPRHGPFIVAANHLSFIDPPLLCASLPRRITFMVKEELFFHPIWGAFIRAFGALPVRRGYADRGALRQALRLLRRGAALGVFPEGTRSRTGRLQPGHSGVSLVAVRAGVPVLPVAITGSERIRGLSNAFRRPTIAVRVGQPVMLTLSEEGTAASSAQATDLIMARIAALLPPERQGPYALRGQPVPGAAAGMGEA